MKEEGIEFTTAKNIFYNQEMQFCRSFFSLAVGAIGDKINVLDAFSATGIRGIRYTKENKNVKKIDFLEANDYAIPIIKKNLKKNKIKANIIKNLYEKYLTAEVAGKFFFYDFIEIDSFGTPVLYLWSTFYGQQKKKRFYLSVTATDMAVLCGHETKACLKNYHSKSLNNEFTHETGIRILVKRIADAAVEYNFGITPLISISDRHYIKVLVEVENCAKKANETIAKLGYISYCNECSWRIATKRMYGNCAECDRLTDYAGQIWLGELHDHTFLNKMDVLNKKRNYEHSEEIRRKITLMKNEIGMPQYYYNIHVMCKRINAKTIPKLDAVIDKLKKNGFRASRTHFNSNSIKTDASIKEVYKTIGPERNRTPTLLHSKTILTPQLGGI